MNQNTTLLLSVVTGIILSVFSNWLYDLLKNKKILPDKNNVKMILALMFAFSPILAFVLMSPQPESQGNTGNSVSIEGDVNNSPFFIDNQGNVTIIQNIPLPTPQATTTLSVNDKVTSNICVKKDDVISVRATGGIIVGQLVGSVGPDGKDSGVLDISLDPYDLYPEFSHGALLCKLDTQEKWRECNASADFQAQVDGCLQFDVNDNEKINNSGSFDVNIDVFSQ